jgi:protein tyrosine phosphatase
LVSKSKTSLHNYDHEYYSDKAPSTEFRHSHEALDRDANKNYVQGLNYQLYTSRDPGQERFVPSYDHLYGAQVASPYSGLSKSYGDISHEKSMSVMSAATMVVVPDADGQHEQIVQNVVDGGLKTLDPKLNRRTSDPQICTENILEGVVDVENILKNQSRVVAEKNEAENDGAEIEQRLRKLQQKTENGAVENEFRHLSSVTQVVNIEDVQDAVQLKIGEFKHQFLTLQAPRSQDDKSQFWRRIWKEKSTIILQLNNTDSDYFCEGPVKNDYRISYRHPEKQDTSFVIRQLLLTKLANNRDAKKRKLYHIQLRTWLSEEGAPLAHSVDYFRQLDEFLESILNEKKGKYPLVIVSEDSSTFFGIFLLSRIILHSAQHNEEDIEIEDVLLELRKFNPSFVPRLDQYLFVYRLLISFLQKFRLI